MELISLKRRVQRLDFSITGLLPHEGRNARSKMILSTMCYRMISLICSLIVLPVLLPGQSDGGDVVRAFRQAEAELVLLRNERNLVPLKDLGEQRIAYVGIGLKAVNDFQSTLEKYTQVTVEAVPRLPVPEELNAWGRRLRETYSLVIIGINDYDYEGLSPVLESGAALRTLIGRLPTAVVVIGGENAFTDLRFLGEADALLVTPYNAYALSLAAQALFGGVGVKGRLSRDLNDRFRTGAGLTTSGGLRLRYSPPEVAGFDRQLMEDSIRAIISEGIRRGAFPGANVLVARHGQVVFHQAFGYHTYDQQQPVKTTDVYDFASVTKISSGLPAVMKLYGEGKFDLDAPLSRYYPEFRSSNKADVTYRRVLTHSGRLLAWIPFWRGTLRGNARYPWKKRWDNTMLNEGRFKAGTFKPDSSARFPVRVTDDLWLHRHYKDKMLAAIRKSPLNKEPGYVYSDLSFYLWPEILPRITGQPFEEYLKETFYRPLGAYTLTYNAYQHFPLADIIPTERDTFFRKVQLLGTVHDEGAAMLSGISGHAGLFGSANDLAKLMQLYLNKGTYGDQRFIAEKAVEAFTSYQYPEEGIRRGIGFDKPLLEYNAGDSYIAKSASAASFGHSGYTGTFTWVDPENGLLLILFTNRVYPTRDNRKLYQLGLRPRLHQALYDAIRE